MAHCFFAAADATIRGDFNASQLRDYWLDNVQCVGNETFLVDCEHGGIDVHNCGSGERAGVHCLSKCNSFLSLLSPLLVHIYNEMNAYADFFSGPIDIGIRLVAGPNATSGIIQLGIRGEWRSVCHDSWTNADAVVACRQLGLPHPRKLSVLYVYVPLSGSCSNCWHACAYLPHPQQCNRKMIPIASVLDFVKALSSIFMTSENSVCEEAMSIGLPQPDCTYSV